MAAEIYVDEFLYRGRPSGDAQESAWHVTLGAADTDAFGKLVISTNGPMTSEAAAALGYPLPTLISTINASLLAQNEQLQAKIVDLQTQLSSLTAPAPTT